MMKKKSLLIALATLLIAGIGLYLFLSIKSKTENYVGPKNSNKIIDEEKMEDEEGVSESVSESATALRVPIAFVYQTVGLFEKSTNKKQEEGGQASSDIAVRLGISYDGTIVDVYDKDAINWTISKEYTDIYGDPVMSRLTNGDWAMTAWTSPDDSRGAGSLLYHESSCPFVVDEDVIAIVASKEKGCERVGGITGAKTSQIFSAEDGNYVFHMIGGSIYLMHISDAKNEAMDLKEVCILKEEPEELADLAYGESTLIVSKEDSGNLLMSDTAMGRRSDGTWVLFVKGIPEDNGCSPNSVCELCARGIYRTTSTDLLNWTTLEKVVGEASVPEATTTADGIVWLYWQDFDKVCEAEDQSLGAYAPISASYEIEDTYELSEPVQISFPDEDFESNSSMHYATNGNPVMLPDEVALKDYEACMQ